MNSSSEFQQIKIKKFDGTDFNFWKGKVTNGLMFLGLDGFIAAKPEPTNADQVMKDKKALAFIKEALSDSLFRKYNETTTKDLWDKLKTDYEVIDAQLLFVKRNKFLFCVKSRNESMSDYINRLMQYKNELKDAGNEVSDKDFILTIMNGTHNEYGNFVSAMTGKKNIDEIAANDLINQLIKEDDLRRSMKRNEAKIKRKM